MENQNNQWLDESLSSYDRTFKPFFTTRVMSKVEQLNEQFGQNRVFDLFFKRVLIGGSVTVAAMIVILMLGNGGISVDALLGLADLDTETSMAMAISKF